MWNTGYKGYQKRIRIINGTADGFEENNTPTGGVGPYLPPFLDLVSCPTTSSSTTTSSTTTTTTTAATTTSSTSTSTSTSTTSSTTTTTTTLAPQYVCPSFPNSYNSGTSTVTYSFIIPNEVLSNPNLAKIKAIIYNSSNIEIGSQTFILPNTPDPNNFNGSINGIGVSDYVFGINYLNSSNVVLASPCELPVIVSEIVSLGSPDKILYNSSDNMIYYIEADSVAAVPGLNVSLGGIGYFNPLTATTVNDIIYPTSAYNSGSSGAVLNPANNKIYCQGYNSAGLVIFSCTSKTVTKKISYSTINSQDMGPVYLVGDKVYANYTVISGFKVVDTNTDNLLADYIPPTPSGHISFYLLEVGTEMWVFYSGSPTTPSKVTIYNSSDLTTVIATINDLNTTTAGNARYTITQPILDFNGKIWYSSLGESTVYSIDPITRTIVNTIAVPHPGKNYASVFGLRHEKSETIYFTGNLNDNVTEAGDPFTVRIDTTLGTIVQTYPGISFSNFVYSPINNRTYGASPGRHVYNSPNTGYDSDGKIVVYN